MNDDKTAQEAVEQTKQDKGTQKKSPVAGPHARENLTDNEKTPGTGSLPERKSNDIDAGSE